MSYIKEHQLFITSVYEGTLPEVDNNIAMQEAFALQSVDEGRKFSNYGGWQSNDLRADEMSAYPELVKIIRGVYQGASEVAKAWRFENQPELIACWININSKGDFNWPHVHPWSQLSACYYINMPDEAGGIGFIRGDSTGEYMPAVKEPTRNTLVKKNFNPPAGTFYVFPSNLKHLVYRNESDSPRISIAFNFQG